MAEEEPMADERHPRKPKKRSGPLVAVIAIIMALLLAEAALVVAVFTSPSATERLQGSVSRLERAWSGTKDSPGIQGRASGAASRAYRGWIEPLWSMQVSPEGGRDFAECVSCHKDYAKQRRFTSVYMNHPLHAELGAECATCHTQNVHPSPPRPEESTCAECHKETEKRGECGLCHPPASLPHFYLLGATKGAVAQCNVCHPKGAFDSKATSPLVKAGAFNGSDKSRCLACHDEAKCESCHGQGHPSDWLRIHGQDVSRGGSGDCAVCHTLTWCSDSCHAVTPGQPLPPKPIPSGVEP